MKVAIILLATACAVSACTISFARRKQLLVREFTHGNRRFTGKLYKELLEVESGNMVVSPFSAQSILALTLEGARGESAREMFTGLFLPSTRGKIQKAFKSFLSELKSTHTDSKLSIANKIYAGEGVELEDDFKQVAMNVYESDVETVDFNNNIEAVGKINGWVEDRTEHRIKGLIDPDTIDGYTKLVLVNTLYFNGRWQIPFNRYQTGKKEFYSSEYKIVELDMMIQTDYLNYYENTDLNAKFLELSYENSNVSMVFILPNEKDGLTALEQNMENLLEPQPLRRERVEVQIPKFRFETSINMIPILRGLGIEKVFSDEEADLSGLSSTQIRLSISEIVQKVFIEVNEDGTEAAAATEVEVAESVPPPPTGNFIADHPFAFYIQFNGVILFTGRYTN